MFLLGVRKGQCLKENVIIAICPLNVRSWGELLIVGFAALFLIFVVIKNVKQSSEA